MVPHRSATKVNQSETTLKYLDPLQTHKYHTHAHTHTHTFVEAHSYHFTPLDSLHDNVTDTDDNSDLVQSELKNGKAPGIDNVYNDILKKAIGSGFYKLFRVAANLQNSGNLKNVREI